MTTERLIAEEILKGKIVPFNVAEWNFLHHVLHSGEIYKLIIQAMEAFAAQEVEAEIEKRMPTEKEAREQAELKYADPYHRAWWVGGALWAIGLFRSRMKGENK